MAFLFACGKFLGFAQLSSRIRIRVEAAEYSSRHHVITVYKACFFRIEPAQGGVKAVSGADCVAA